MASRAACACVEGDAIARWVRRHPEGERLLAGLQASDIALAQLIAQLTTERPEATLADVRARIRALKEARG